jgi:hypothetical protein
MRVAVYHNGVPIGEADLRGGELVIAEFEPNAAYAGVQPVIREASEVLWSLGFFHSEGTRPRLPAEALGRAARLPLELRDAQGKQLAADFVNLVERPGAGAAPVLFARFRHAHAGVPAALRPPNREPGSTSGPDA